MIDKIRQLARFLNERGLPLPMVRDPRSSRASVSLTMMVVSFTVAVVGLLGKASGFFGGIDLSQSMVLLTITAGLYFSRKLSRDDKGGVTLDTEEKKEE